jgi:hypothetical protein
MTESAGFSRGAARGLQQLVRPINAPKFQSHVLALSRARRSKPDGKLSPIYAREYTHASASARSTVPMQVYRG